MGIVNLVRKACNDRGRSPVPVQPNDHSQTAHAGKTQANRIISRDQRHEAIDRFKLVD